MQYNKRLYTIKQYFTFLDDMIYSVKDVMKAKRNQLVSDQLQERIMLAVTEVNGCRLCSYYHAKEALKAGISEEELESLQNGEDGNIPEKEMNAVLFAKYYASSAGKIDKDIYEQIVQEYSEDKAKAILGYIRMIMIGNVSGIAYGALKSRMRGNKIPESSFSYETGILLSTVFFIPLISVMRLFRPRKLL